MSALSKAISYAASRKTVLPSEFYGLDNARHRAASFTISGNIPIDVIENVRQSLDRALQRGTTFQQWQRVVGRATGLPGYRLENVFRNYMNFAFQAGRCKSISHAKTTRQFLMYVAVGGRQGDGRTRPSHAARHGIIRPVDDEYWDQGNMPPISHNCRCNVIQLSSRQMEARGGVTQNPVNPFDDGDFGINVCNQGSEEITRRSLRGKLDSCGLGTNAVWCSDNALFDTMQSSLEQLEDWILPAVLAAQLFNNYEELEENVNFDAAVLGIDPGLAVAIDQYQKDQFTKADNASRNAARGLNADEDMGLLNSLIDRAFEASETIPGTYYLRVPDIGLGLVNKAKAGKAFRLETFLNTVNNTEDLGRDKGNVILIIQAPAMQSLNNQMMIQRGTQFRVESIQERDNQTFITLVETSEDVATAELPEVVVKGVDVNLRSVSQAR